MDVVTEETSDHSVCDENEKSSDTSQEEVNLMETSSEKGKNPVEMEMDEKSKRVDDANKTNSEEKEVRTTSEEKIIKNDSSSDESSEELGEKEDETKSALIVERNLSSDENDDSSSDEDGTVETTALVPERNISSDERDNSSSDEEETVVISQKSLSSDEKDNSSNNKEKIVETNTALIEEKKLSSDEKDTSSDDEEEITETNTALIAEKILSSNEKDNSSDNEEETTEENTTLIAEKSLSSEKDNSLNDKEKATEANAALIAEKSLSSDQKDNSSYDKEKVIETNTTPTVDRTDGRESSSLDEKETIDTITDKKESFLDCSLEKENKKLEELKDKIKVIETKIVGNSKILTDGDKISMNDIDSDSALKNKKTSKLSFEEEMRNAKHIKLMKDCRNLKVALIKLSKSDIKILLKRSPTKKSSKSLSKTPTSKDSRKLMTPKVSSKVMKETKKNSSKKSSLGTSENSKKCSNLTESDDSDICIANLNKKPTVSKTNKKSAKPLSKKRQSSSESSAEKDSTSEDSDVPVLLAIKNRLSTETKKKQVEGSSSSSKKISNIKTVTMKSKLDKGSSVRSSVQDSSSDDSDDLESSVVQPKIKYKPVPLSKRLHLESSVKAKIISSKEESHKKDVESYNRDKISKEKFKTKLASIKKEVVSSDSDIISTPKSKSKKSGNKQNENKTYSRKDSSESDTQSESTKKSPQKNSHKKSYDKRVTSDSDSEIALSSSKPKQIKKRTESKKNSNIDSDSECIVTRKSFDRDFSPLANKNSSPDSSSQKLRKKSYTSSDLSEDSSHDSSPQKSKKVSYRDSSSNSSDKSRKESSPEQSRLKNIKQEKIDEDSTNRNLHNDSSNNKDIGRKSRKDSFEKDATKGSGISKNKNQTPLKEVIVKREPLSNPESDSSVSSVERHKKSPSKKKTKHKEAEMQKRNRGSDDSSSEDERFQSKKSTSKNTSIDKTKIKIEKISSSDTSSLSDSDDDDRKKQFNITGIPNQTKVSSKNTNEVKEKLIKTTKISSKQNVTATTSKSLNNSQASKGKSKISDMQHDDDFEGFEIIHSKINVINKGKSLPSSKVPISLKVSSLTKKKLKNMKKLKVTIKKLNLNDYRVYGNVFKSYKVSKSALGKELHKSSRELSDIPQKRNDDQKSTKKFHSHDHKSDGSSHSNKAELTKETHSSGKHRVKSSEREKSNTSIKEKDSKDSKRVSQHSTLIKPSSSKSADVSSIGSKSKVHIKVERTSESPEPANQGYSTALESRMSKGVVSSKISNSIKSKTSGSPASVSREKDKGQVRIKVERTSESPEPDNIKQRSSVSTIDTKTAKSYEKSSSHRDKTTPLSKSTKADSTGDKRLGSSISNDTKKSSKVSNKNSTENSRALKGSGTSKSTDVEPSNSNLNDNQAIDIGSRSKSDSRSSSASSTNVAVDEQTNQKSEVEKSSSATAENSTKSKIKTIPGLSYIIANKDTKGKELSFTYDCVLCSTEKTLWMTGTTMKTHLKERKHLLNVLQIENRELYNKYKEDYITNTSVMFDEVCNCGTISSNKVISTSETYKSKRESLVKLILRKRKKNEIFDFTTLMVKVEKEEETTSGRDSHDPLTICDKISSIPFHIENCENTPPETAEISNELVPDFFAFTEKLINKQKGRSPKQIVFVFDNTESYIEAEYESIKIVRGKKLNFDTLLKSLRSHQALGTDSLIIIFCGIYSLVKATILGICKRRKCKDQLFKYSVKPNITSKTLISKALRFHEYIINHTENDLVMFCELMPIELSGGFTRRCAKNHTLENEIPFNIRGRYMTVVKEYNDFMVKHSRLVGFKSLNFLKSLFPERYKKLDGHTSSDSKDLTTDLVAEHCVMKNILGTKPIKNQKKKPLRNSSNDAKQTMNRDDERHSPYVQTQSISLEDNNRPQERSMSQGKDERYSPYVQKQRSKRSTSRGEDDMESTSVWKRSHEDSSSALKQENPLFDKIVIMTNSSYHWYVEKLTGPNIEVIFSDLDNSDLLSLIEKNKTTQPERTLWLSPSGIFDVAQTRYSDVCLSSNPSCANCLLQLVPNEKIVDKSSNITEQVRRATLSLMDAVNAILEKGSAFLVLPPIPPSILILESSKHYLYHDIASEQELYYFATKSDIIRLQEVYSGISRELISMICSQTLKIGLPKESLEVYKLFTKRWHNHMEVKNYDTFLHDRESLLLKFREWLSFMKSFISSCLQTGTNVNGYFTPYNSASQLFSTLKVYHNDSQGYNHVVIVACQEHLKIIPRNILQSKNVSLICVQYNEQWNTYWEVDCLKTLKNVLVIFIPNVMMLGTKGQEALCTSRKCDDPISYFNLEDTSVTEIVSEKLKRLFYFLSSLMNLFQDESRLLTIYLLPKYCYKQPRIEMKNHSFVHQFMKWNDDCCILRDSSITWNKTVFELGKVWNSLSENLSGKFLKGIQEQKQKYLRDCCQHPLVWQFIEKGPISDKSKGQKQLNECIENIFHLAYDLLNPELKESSSNVVETSSKIELKKFKKVVIITDKNYTQYAKKITNPQVEIIVRDTKNLDNLENMIQKSSKSQPPNTLWLLIQGCLSIAETEYSNMCQGGTPCIKPLLIIVPTHEFKREDVVKRIMKNYFSLTQRINAALNPDSSFLIAPPIPPTFIEVEDRYHEKYHEISDKSETYFYLTNRRATYDFDKYFKGLNTEMLSLVLSDVRRLNISEKIFNDYNDMMNNRKHHIFYTKYEEFIRPSDKGNKYQEWLKILDRFIDSCVIPDGISRRDVTHTRQKSDSFPARYPRSSSSDTVEVDRPWEKNSSPASYPRTTVSDTVEVDRPWEKSSSSTSYHRTVSDNIVAEHLREVNNFPASYLKTSYAQQLNVQQLNDIYDHIVLLCCGDQEQQFRIEEEYVRYISKLTLRNLDWNEVKSRFETMESLFTYRSILFVFIGDAKCIASECPESSCISMRCNDALHYWYLSGSPDMIKNMITDNLAKILNLAAHVKTYFSDRAKVILAPLFSNICAEKPFSGGSRDVHYALHKSIMDAGCPYLLDGGKQKWNEAIEEFNYGWRKNIFVVLADANEKLQSVIEKFLFSESMPLIHWQDIQQPYAYHTSVELIKRRFIKSLVTLELPRSEQRQTKDQHIDSHELGPIRSQTSLPIRADTGTSLSQGNMLTTKEHSVGEQIPKLVLEKSDMQETYDKIFDSAFLLGKSNVGIEALKVQNIKYIFHDMSHSPESEITTIMQKMGNTGRNALCIIALDFLAFTKMLSISPDCKTQNCPVPISAIGINADGDDSFGSVSSCAMSKMMEFISFATKLSIHIPLLILPLFPIKIFCDNGSMDVHRQAHVLANRNSVVVHGKKNTWETYTGIVADLWNNFVKTNYEKYFSSEKLEKFMKNYYKFVTYEGDVQKLVICWEDILQAFCNHLVKKIPSEQDVSKTTDPVSSTTLESEAPSLTEMQEMLEFVAKTGRLTARSQSGEKSNNSSLTPRTRRSKSGSRGKRSPSRRRNRSDSRSRSRRSRERSGSRYRSYRSPSRSRIRRSRSKSRIRRSRSRSRYNRSPPLRLRSRSKSKSRQGRSHSQSRHKRSRSKSPYSSQKRRKEGNTQAFDKPDRDNRRQSSDAEESTQSLINMLGDKIYKEYIAEKEKLDAIHKSEFSVYINVPDLHYNHDKFYKEFCIEYERKFGNRRDHNHKEVHWKEFWKNRMETVKQEEWKSKVNNLLRDFKQKSKVPSASKESRTVVDKIVSDSYSTSTWDVPSASFPNLSKEDFYASLLKSYESHSTTHDSAHLSQDSYSTARSHSPFKSIDAYSKGNSTHLQDKNIPQISSVPSSRTVRSVPSPSDHSTLHSYSSSTEKFSVNETLNLLEQLSHKLGMLGPAIMALIKAAKDFKNNDEAISLFKDEENQAILGMAVDKFKVLERNASKDEAQILLKTVDNVSYFLEYIRNRPKSLDVKELALKAKSKGSAHTLNLIKSAFVDIGKSNPTKEEINEIYLKICTLHFEMSLENTGI